MSDTTRTDALLDMRNLRWDQLGEHARQLERELAQAREGWIEECAKVCDGEAVRATICVGKLSGADMAKLTAESLAEAIRALKRSRGGAT